MFRSSLPPPLLGLLVSIVRENAKEKRPIPGILPKAAMVARLNLEFETTKQARLGLDRPGRPFSGQPVRGGHVFRGAAT